GTLHDLITVATADGTTHQVDVTINGANDAAVITGTSTGNVTEAGGVANAIPGTPMATGDLLATDVDNVTDSFQAVAGAVSASGYGTYEVTAAGVWRYTLDNTNSMVQALDNGGSLSDSFTVHSDDGTAKLVTVTIHGANDVLFDEHANTVDFNAVVAGTYTNGTQYDALGGNDVVTLPADDAAVTRAGYDPARPFLGGEGNDTIMGGGLNDIIDGGNGGDVISGGAGNDSINGGAGNDELFGEDGDDRLNGGAGNDSISGGAGNDNLFGEDGNDTLNGGAGIDVMSGGAGNDTYVVDNEGDVVFENENEGTDLVLSSVTYALGDHVENLTLTGNAHITGNGNFLDNVITGNDGDNVLDGISGNDTLNGGAGNDMLFAAFGTGNNTLNGGAGNDFLSVSFGTGANTLNGGAGDDTLVGGSGNDVFQYSFNVNPAVTSDDGFDTIYDFTFGAGADKLEFSGVTQQQFLDNFNVDSSQDVDSDGVADTVITINGFNDWSVNLSGVSGHNLQDFANDAIFFS
ncbi:MAG: VCBS domain-containing protein, partial [Burkholderiales bacterium]